MSRTFSTSIESSRTSAKKTRIYCNFQGLHCESNLLISQHGYEVFEVIGQKMEI